MIVIRRRKIKTVFVDFETFYSTKQKYDLRNISIVEYVHHPEFYVQGWGMKIDDGETKWYSGKYIDLLPNLLDWSQVRVAAHNAKFDGAILSKHGIQPAQWIDTQAMSKAVLGSSVPSHSLKAVAEHLGLPAKGELRTNNIKELTADQEEELATYCKRDVDLCHDIFNALLPHFPGSQWQILDWTVRAFLEPKLVLDGKKCETVYKQSLTKKETAIAKTGVEKKVFSSNQQFADLLKKEGFNVPMKKNKDGKNIPALSIGDKEFLALKDIKVQRLQDLITARIAVKQTLEETRAKKLWDISKIGPYHFDVIFSGAQQTHRFSGGNGCAGNPQNFRRGSELRAAITVPEGKALVVADFSNIELRVLAFLAKAQELMESIKKKEDVYCKFASKIYNRTITKKDKKERFLGKAAVLGLGYGMGAEKFKNTVYAQTGEMIDDEFAKSVVKLYRDVYKGVPRFWKICEEVLSQIHKNPRFFPGNEFLKLHKEAIELPSGLLIKFKNLRFTWKKMFNIWKKEWKYDRYKSKATKPDATKIYGGMLTENLCQGIAGEVCKEAIKRLIEFGYPPSGQVHDELLVVCDEDEIEKVKYLVKVAMTEAMPWFKELPLEVEINAGRNWLECK